MSVKQPILVLLGRNNKNHNNNESSSQQATQNWFSANVAVTQTFKQPKVTQQNGPTRPVTLFTHPVQQPTPTTSNVLTPGTLLKMSGGNCGKKLTILSPNTVDSVFASDEGTAVNKSTAKQAFAQPNFPNSGHKDASSGVEEITEIEIPSRSSVGSDKFSPSCFLRSPHFATSKSQDKKESLTSPMDHQTPVPGNYHQQVNLGMLQGSNNSAGGYGVGSYHQGSLSHNLNQSASFAGQADQSNSSPMNDELANWLDMSNVLPPCEMEALQKELELGSPMNVDPFHI